MKKSMITASWQRFSAFFAALLLAFAVTGCSTMEGFGEDVEKAGEKIQDSAEKHQ